VSIKYSINSDLLAYSLFIILIGVSGCFFSFSFCFDKILVFVGSIFVGLKKNLISSLSKISILNYIIFIFLTININ
jgi:hypothetical protein